MKDKEVVELKEVSRIVERIEYFQKLLERIKERVSKTTDKKALEDQVNLIMIAHDLDHEDGFNAESMIAARVNQIGDALWSIASETPEVKAYFAHMLMQEAMEGMMESIKSDPDLAKIMDAPADKKWFN